MANEKNSDKSLLRRLVQKSWLRPRMKLLILLLWMMRMNDYMEIAAARVKMEYRLILCDLWRE